MQDLVPARKRHNDSNSSARHQEQKKQKYEGPMYATVNNGSTTLDAIVDCIFGMPSLMDIGVELRVGKLSGDRKKFVSCLSEQDFQVIYGQVKRQAKVISESDHFYDHGRYNNACLTVDEEGGVTKAVHKELISSFDMETNLPFDMRVSVARDTSITPLPAAIDEDFTKKVSKMRFSVEGKDWILNIVDATNGETRSYELEARIRISSILACADHRACVSLLGSVFAEVHNLLARLQESGAQLFPDLKLERVTNPDLHAYLKREFMQLVPGVHTQDRFPGSQPTPLERSKIKTLQTGKYWVSEKSDGLRYFLFFIDEHAYFVDRKMDFLQIHKFSFLVDLFGRKGVTLLDGEMVRHLRTGKLMFLIFDILALNGKTNIGAYGLLDRLGIITKQVVEVFRAACKVCNMKDDSSRLQFSLAGKIFRNKMGIEILADMIKTQETGERLFIDERRCHRNDGLIFTLDGPYLPYSSSHLLKWKYADRLSIDFRLRSLNDGSFSASVGSGRNMDREVRSFDLSPEDWERVKLDLKKNRNPKEVIIECAFNASKHQWSYLNLRPDKNMPNHYNTMENTKRIVIDNITMEELVYRVPKDPSCDFWEKLHPELFNKQQIQADRSPAKSPSSDKSPSVDLPATPVDSPITYLSPSQSLQSPSSSQQTPKATSAPQQQHAPATPPSMFGVTSAECTDMSSYFNLIAPPPPASLPLPAFTESCATQLEAMPLFDNQTFSSDNSQLFSAHSPTHLQTLSPPTSPSAFFS